MAAPQEPTLVDEVRSSIYQQRGSFVALDLHAAQESVLTLSLVN
jgi:hypothetical protein